MSCNKNLASWDRLLRLLVGVALIGAVMSFKFEAWMQYALFGTGLVLSLSSLFGFCPAYALLGIGCQKGQK